MEVIYYVTIEAVKKENIFSIKWTNNKKEVHSFDQPVSDIEPEEVEWMWKDRRNQLRIGEKLFRFLDGDEGNLQRVLEEADNHAETLQVHLSTCRETSNWPFELLAQNGSFLLPHRLHLVRRVPVKETAKELPPLQPQNRCLRLLFMACSPLDVQPELDFEKEEEAIFKITEKLAIDMEVEDTGSLEGLRQKLQQQQYDIVHLSGYADIDKKEQPFFVMENETGNRENVPVEKLWYDGLKANPPRLLFISGSSTGDAPDGTEGAFAHMLVEKYQIPAVLGWGRWISDGEANEAAKVIYKELSRGKSVLDAVQRARHQLIDRFPSILKPAWPQLRLFSSGGTLDAMVTSEQKRQPQTRRMTHVHLKNSEVKVLLEGFVGRRRQLQQSFRALTQEPGKIGLLILGTGGLGKSCLAGKVSERFKEHTLIIIHGRLNSLSLKRALKDAFIVARDDHGKNVLSWEMEMKDILGVLCRSCFKDKKYLILLDDFEQNLESSDKGEPGGLFPEAVELLKVLLDCLSGTGKNTQMMITCRYGFSLPSVSNQTSDAAKYPARRAIKSFSGGPGGRFFKKVPLAAGGSLEGSDLVKERLEWVWLTGFREPEQKKKVGELPHILKQKEPSTIAKLLAAGCGNPRLMEWLDVLVGQMTTAEVSDLLQAVNKKKEKFIHEHVIRELLKKGGDDLTRFLQWFAIYRRPVLKEGAKEIGQKAGLKTWNDLLLHRGMDLSLIEHDRARLSYQGTPLLREELLKELDDHQLCHEAAFCYYKSICEGKPSVQFDPILVEEWVHHALECGEEDVASNEGGALVNYFRANLALLESQRVGLWVMEKKKRELSTENDAFLLNETANTIQTLGNPLKSIEFFVHALNINEALFGQWHPKVAIQLSNLGVAWADFGDYRKAIGYFEKALALDEVVLEGEDVAIRLNNLGVAWAKLGDHPKAIDYYQKALTVDKTVFGLKHPNTARDYANLGESWRALGKPKKAINYLQQALIADKAVFGPEHPSVAIRMNNLSRAWTDLGNYRKALYYSQEAMNIEEAVFGRKHPKVARDLNNLGELWNALGELKKSIDCYQEALKINERVFGRQHINTAINLNNLGLAWKESGNPRKAIDYIQEALTIDESVFGPEHPNVAIELNNLGAAWRDLGEPKKSLYYSRKALTSCKRAYGENHPQVAIALSNLGGAWKELGNHLKATNYYQQALKTFKDVYGEKHPQAATVLNNLGEACRVSGEPRKAIDHYKQALKIFKNVYGEKHPQVATVLNNLGEACRASGEPKKAIDYFQEALTIDKSVFGLGHPNTAIRLYNLGVAYFNLAQMGTANDHLEQAYAILNKFFGPEHPKTKATAEWLEMLREENGVGNKEANTRKTAF